MHAGPGRRRRGRRRLVGHARGPRASRTRRATGSAGPGPTAARRQGVPGPGGQSPRSGSGAAPPVRGRASVAGIAPRAAARQGHRPQAGRPGRAHNGPDLHERLVPVPGRSPGHQRVRQCLRLARSERLPGHGTGVSTRATLTSTTASMVLEGEYEDCSGGVLADARQRPQGRQVARARPRRGGPRWRRAAWCRERARRL